MSKSDNSNTNRRISEHELVCEKRYSKIEKQLMRLWYTLLVVLAVGVTSESIIWKAILLLAKAG